MWTFDHEGPKSRIEDPHYVEGFSEVHEGPHRDHGHVLHNAKHGHGPIRVLKGPQGTTHSMVPLRDQNLDPKSRVQNVVPE